MEYPKYSLLFLLLIIMLKCFQQILNIYEYLKIIKNQKKRIQFQNLYHFA